MTLGDHSVLDAWLTGVNTGSLDEVVALYDDSAILLLEPIIQLSKFLFGSILLY